MRPESRATQPCEPCQGRKAAALSSRLGVPRGRPGGATCMGIACRGSVKAGCAAFVNPRTGFLMPVRFSVYGPRGLSCPSRPPLPLRYRATPGAAVPAAASGGGGGRAQRAQRRGPWPPPLVWLAGGPKAPRPPNAAAPPGPTGAHYRSGLSLLFSTRFMDTPLALSAGPSCGKSKKAA